VGGSVYVIAEMACSHDGDPGLARTIIDGAGRAGADAIQFQVWSRADLLVPHHRDYDKLGKIELSRSDWAGLAKYVRDTYPRMHIVACVYERGSVEFCESIGIDAYKLHSGDLDNPQLVKCVAATGRRIDLSVGASTVEEIQAAIGWIRALSASPIWLMYGYQDFPTRIDDVHLSYMQKLRALFELPLGYQDHSAAESEAGFWLPAAAIGMGVDILEKHITHDRARKGVDHEAALNPDEFARFVEMVRSMERARGVSTPKPFSPEQLRYRKHARKSIVTSRSLPAGTVLCESDLAALRTEEPGLPPVEVGRLVGKKVIRALPQYHPIRESDVQ